MLLQVVAPFYDKFDEQMFHHEETSAYVIQAQWSSCLILTHVILTRQAEKNNCQN
jgi:hypothetical protein